MTKKIFKLTINKNGVAELLFDLPGEKVNKLSSPVMQELDKQLDIIAASKKIKALIIKSAKPGIFIAGADIKEIESITNVKDGENKAKEGHKIFFKLENLKVPTIAAIDGACLGGGLELALACKFRIVSDSPKTKIGLPETSLGILPGFGGTQRLPRLIGLQAALQLILPGKVIDGKKAFKIHLADKFVPAVYINEKAAEFAEELLNPKSCKKYLRVQQKRIPIVKLLEHNPLGRALIYKLAKKNIYKTTKGFYPAPLKALRSIKAGFRTFGKHGYKVEARLLGELIITDVSKNLIQLFYTSEALKKDSGIDNDKLKAAEFNKSGIVGAGFMGGSIAQLFAYKGLTVRIKDLSWEAIALAQKTAAGLFYGLVKRRRLSKGESAIKQNLISGSLDFKGFANCDFIVEAVFENLKVKKQVFKDISAVASPKAILATNTSALPISEMAKMTKHPDKVIGFHFFSPVHRMPLIEVIPGQKTSEQTILDTVAFAKKLGKTPIVIGEGPGFLVNRILFPYLNEAAHLLAEGVPMKEIEKAAVKFGMPLGPLALMDEVGIPVCLHVAKILEEGFKDQPRAKTAQLLLKLAELKLSGKKGKAGFFIYKKKKKIPNKKITKGIKPRNISNREITDRLLFTMINEGASAISDKIITNPAYLDMAMIMGTGFPPFRGGLLKYADRIGAAKIVKTLKYFEKKYGPRFKPEKLLEEQARTDRTFY